MVFRKVPPKHPHCPLCSQLNCLIGIKFKCLILPFPKHKRSNILNSFVSSRKRVNGCWFAVQFTPEVLGNCPSSSDHFIKCSPFPQYTIFYGGEVQKCPEVSESFGRKKRRGRNGCWFAVQSRKWPFWEINLRTDKKWSEKRSNVDVNFEHINIKSEQRQLLRCYLNIMRKTTAWG